MVMDESDIARVFSFVALLIGFAFGWQFGRIHQMFNDWESRARPRWIWRLVFKGETSPKNLSTSGNKK